MAQAVLWGIHGWRGKTLLALLVATPLTFLVLVGSNAQSRADVTAASGLVTYTLVLGGAVASYIHWRMASSRVAVWLAIALTITAAEGLLQSVSWMTGQGAAITGGWRLVAELAMGLVLCAVALVAMVAQGTHVGRNRAVVSVVGALVLINSLFILAVRSDLNITPPLYVAGMITLGLLGEVAIVWMVLKLTSLPIVARRRLAVAVVALGVAQSLGSVGRLDAGLLTLAVAANLFGAILLGLTALALLRTSIWERERRLNHIHDSLAEVRAQAEVDREQFHEISSTIAGIACASRIIRHHHDLSAPRRNLLEEMLEAELARLERLMRDRAPSTRRDFDVDETILQQVVSHRARGQIVRWSPGSHLASGQPDDLAEVLNILLDNAAAHGRGSIASVVVENVGGFVEIICSDAGPGVGQEVHGQLFESGIRGPDSAGQGLGLAIARRLMTKHGGSLELVDDAAPGATFVARLPQPVMAHGALDHAAQ